MCRLCEVLYVLVPIHPFRGWLLRKHMAGCPRCSRDLTLTGPAARAVAEIPPWIRLESSLWPRVKAEISVPRSEPGSGKIRPAGPPAFIHWRYAVAALSLVLFIAAHVLIQQRLPVSSTPGMTAAAPSSVTVNFAEVQGKKARHHIYKTSSRSYIWFVQTKDNGGE
ncbi:hypothetical protein ACFLR7_06420 [Acidobacteriota bacterium]